MKELLWNTCHMFVLKIPFNKYFSCLLVDICNFLIFLIELYVFLHCPPFLSSSPFSSSPHPPHSLKTSFLYLLPMFIRFMCFSLRVLLLSRFSGIVNCKLVSLCSMSKSHLWVSTYYIFLSGSGLLYSVWCFLDPSIWLQISSCH